MKIEVMKNPRFMSEARRKELEWGKEKRLREESTSMPVVKEKRKLSSSHPHHRRGELEAHAASAIQQPVWIMNKNGSRKLWVHPVFFLPPLPSKVTSPPAKQSGSPFKGWFHGSLKGSLGPPPTVYTAILNHAAA